MNILHNGIRQLPIKKLVLYNWYSYLLNKCSSKNLSNKWWWWQDANMFYGLNLQWAYTILFRYGIMDIYSRYTHAVQDSRMRLACLVGCFCTWVVENRSKLWTASQQPHFTNHTVKEEPSRGLVFQMQLKPREHQWLQRHFVFLLRKHLNNFLHTSRDLP